MTEVKKQRNTAPNAKVTDVRFLACPGFGDGRRHDLYMDMEIGRMRCSGCKELWADLDQEVREKGAKT